VEGHSIRLRGPWQVPIDGTMHRVSVPCTLADVGVASGVGDVGDASAQGTITFYRRFGKPSHLANGQIVRMRVDGCSGLSGIRVNDVSITSGDDIHPLLRDSNEVALTFLANDKQNGPTGEISIFIEAVCS
jgi:hypothetical protein